MQIRLAADLQEDSIVDGEGIRTVIWTQGCPHHCPGCHNPQTHDFEGGVLVDVEEVIECMDELRGQDGVTFSGGDPFVQPAACAYLAKHAHELGMNVWCYTGYTFEQLIVLSKSKKEVMDFLKQIDVLVDGRFILAEKSQDALFRGSRNQRLIDVPKSLEQNAVVLKEELEEKRTFFSPKMRQGLYV